MPIDEIRGTVEKEIAEKEYQLKLKKKEKSKDKKDNTAPAQSAEVIEIDDDAWEIPSGDDAVDSTAKPKKSDKGSSLEVHLDTIPVADDHLAIWISKKHLSMENPFGRGNGFGRENCLVLKLCSVKLVLRINVVSK